MTYADAALLLDVTAQTLRNWVQSGCPNVPGARGRNGAARVRLGEVMEWRAAQIAGGAAPDDDGQVYDEGRAKAADWHYRAIRRQADARRELGQLVPVDIIADVVEADHQAVRSILSSVAARIAVRLAAESDASVTRRIVGDAIADAMSRISSPERTIERAGGNPRSSIHDPLEIDREEEGIDDDDA